LLGKQLSYKITEDIGYLAMKTSVLLLNINPSSHGKTQRCVLLEKNKKHLLKKFTG